MKTLVIHPKDQSTDFLTPIYEKLKKKTVITGGVTKAEVYEQIKKHDRIIMMGHGSPGGLFSIGRFRDVYGYYIISDETAELLKDKECISIWCNADRYMEFHQLKGFYSGMFISEVGEADYCRIKNPSRRMVIESNDKFSEILSNYIHTSLKYLTRKVVEKYRFFAFDTPNPVAVYNSTRLYLNE